MTARPADHRRVAWGVVAVAGVVLVAVAVAWVPWHPVPGGMPPAVSADSVFTPDEIRRGETYALWARVWSWSGLAISLLVAGWLGFGSVGRRLVGRIPGRWPVRVVVGLAACQAIGLLATLPARVALRIHARNAGLTDQSWPGFARDVAVSAGIGLVSAALALVLLVGLARRLPRWWPAVAGVLAAALVTLGSFVYPVLVEPLFNDFQPLADATLRREIVALGTTVGVPVDDVLVADASRRTTTLNAYVSGFGATHRVVLYDNVLTDLTDPEIVSIVAHELTHARHDDVLVGTTLGAAGAALGVGLLALLVGSAPVRRRDLTVADPRVVPLVLALVSIGSVLVLPAQNAVSRQLEVRADVGALAATGDGATFLALQRALTLTSRSDPTPPTWAHVVFGSHPTVLQRIALARSTP